MNSFNIRALALTSGITYGLCLMLLSWAAYYGWGERMVTFFADFYTGYEATFSGSIIGAIWGFVVGIVFGVIFGALYNHFAKKCKKKLF